MPAVTVLLFASLRESAGASRVEVEASTVGGLLATLAERHGEGFARAAALGSVIVDGERVGPERALRGGEEVAILPPVSGG